MSGYVTCPSCSRLLAVQDESAAELTCPRCLATVVLPRGAPPERSPGSADHEVRGDTRITNVVLLVLTGLCVLGILLTYLAGRGHREAYGEMCGIAVLFGVLDVLVFLKVARPIWGRGVGPSRDAGERFVKILGVVALTLGLALAVFVFFFVACWGVLGTM